MAFKVTRARGVATDLEVTFDFLVASAEGFGEDTETAFAMAQRRIGQIEADMEKLGDAPLQGSLRPHLGQGIRNVTKGRAVFYFDADERAETVRILAVFFGGQDHDTRILLRLLTGG